VAGRSGPSWNRPAITFEREVGSHEIANSASRFGFAMSVDSVASNRTEPKRPCRFSSEIRPSTRIEMLSRATFRAFTPRRHGVGFCFLGSPTRDLPSLATAPRRRRPPHASRAGDVTRLPYPPLPLPCRVDSTAGQHGNHGLSRLTRDAGQGNTDRTGYPTHPLRRGAGSTAGQHRNQRLPYLAQAARQGNSRMTGYPTSISLRGGRAG